MILKMPDNVAVHPRLPSIGLPANCPPIISITVDKPMHWVLVCVCGRVCWGVDDPGMPWSGRKENVGMIYPSPPVSVKKQFLGMTARTCDACWPTASGLGSSTW